VFTVNTDRLCREMKEKAMRGSNEECKARCKQGYKAFLIAYTSVAPVPVDSCN
jgi:hypothetical protein